MNETQKTIMILISNEIQAAIFRVTILTLTLFAFTFVAHGQTKDSTNYSKQQSAAQHNLLSGFTTSEPENQLPEMLLFPDKQNTFHVNNYQEYWILTSPDKPDKLTFSQDHTQKVFPNLGESNQFSGNLFFRATNNLALGFGLELLKQNTVLTPKKPNYQLAFSSSVEFSFNSWLSAYIYGQYLSPSLNQKQFFDPLQYLNPLFKQTEFGSGLRAKHKNIKADLGVKTIQGKDLTETNSSSYFKSKITVGF